MPRFAVLVPSVSSKPYHVRAKTRLDAVVKVLNALGLTYRHTQFMVEELQQ